ncbi:MAG: hypothetical protein JNK02_04335 [Planctomycetes bacterium]|nr:hypothetical protein [Planctomycetota bacterium]
MSTVLALAFLALLPTAPPALQGGYTTEKHPELGLSFPRAREYEQVPTQPDEEFIVLYYAQRVDKVDPKTAKGFRPELNVVWIDHRPPTPPATGDAPDVPPPPEPDQEPRGGSAKEQAPPRPIDSIERWVEQKLKGFELADGKEGRARRGFAGREHELRRVPVKGRPASGARGWVYAWRGPDRTIAFVGFASPDDFDRHVGWWREMAEKAELGEPEVESTEKLERRYATTKFREVPFRVGVRKKLVRGWKAEDTENFILVYNTPDVPLVRKILGDLEVIRKEYEKLFPAARPVTAVSTVRVCKSREEYLTYGGVPGSAGYWNSATEELVLYDAEKAVKGGGKSDADTFIVLYHEAFHQYIHYSTGELPPHSWFNEGHGDFFSGARVKDGKVRGIGPNPWRAEFIQNTVAGGKAIPWSEIVLFEQPEYYRPDRIGICYAQGWAMVYFLRTSPLVQKRPEWARILPTYFDTLKAAWGEEWAKLQAAGADQDRVKRFAGGLAARKRAVEAAFQGVDMLEIDEAWQDFVLRMELPKK